MAKEMTVRSVLEGRQNTYQMLSRLYEEEVDEAYLAQLKKMRCPINTGNTDVDEGYKLFHSYLSHLWERSIEDLKRDYLVTFIGANTTGHSAAYPQESVHTSSSRLLMQDARDEVRAIYRAAGLEIPDSWRQSEDHIAVELEFMVIMGQRAIDALDAGDKAKASKCLMTSYHFLEDHLANWIPLFVDSIFKFAQTDFYRALGYLTRGFIAEDKAFLEEVLEEEIAHERGLDEPANADGGAAAEDVEGAAGESDDAPVVAGERETAA